MVPHCCRSSLDAISYVFAARRRRAVWFKNEQIPAWFKNEQAELDYWCGQIDWMLDPESFKKEIRKNLAKYTLARPNIYWKTFNCGVTMKYYEEGEWKKQDVAHFSFAKNQVGLLVAIACAEHLVLRLQPDQPFCGRFIMVYQLPL